MIEQYITVGSSGGGSTIADPSSFADAYKLFRSDKGFTMVGSQIERWDCQGTNGGQALASSSTYRQSILANLGNYDFQDMWISQGANFYQTGIAAGVQSNVVLQTVYQTFPKFNPMVQYMTWGDQNASDYIMIEYGISSTPRIKVTIKRSGVTSYNMYSFTDFDSTNDLRVLVKLTIRFDGTQATAADRLKCYSGKTLLTPVATSGTHPSDVYNGYDRHSVLSSHTSRQSWGTVGLQAVWLRDLSVAEIEENIDWIDQIWNI